MAEDKNAPKWCYDAADRVLDFIIEGGHISDHERRCVAEYIEDEYDRAYAERDKVVREALHAAYRKLADISHPDTRWEDAGMVAIRTALAAMEE